jgi:protein fantom
MQELQVTHAETVHELEKTRALLSHQDGIAKQQEERAERWVQKASEQDREFAAQRTDFDDTLTKKTNRIAALEKQIRDIAYVWCCDDRVYRQLRTSLRVVPCGCWFLLRSTGCRC